MSQIYKSYENEAEGLKAVIGEGNGKFDFRVTFIDTDAEADGDGVVHVSFSKTFEKAEKKALEFVNMVEHDTDGQFFLSNN